MGLSRNRKHASVNTSSFRVPVLHIRTDCLWCRKLSRIHPLRQCGRIVATTRCVGSQFGRKLRVGLISLRHSIAAKSNVERSCVLLSGTALYFKFWHQTEGTLHFRSLRCPFSLHVGIQLRLLRNARCSVTKLTDRIVNYTKKTSKAWNSI
jgi:hypothetical protein